jgi:hypothetical protein
VQLKNDDLKNGKYSPQQNVQQFPVAPSVFRWPQVIPATCFWHHFILFTWGGFSLEKGVHWGWEFI